MFCFLDKLRSSLLDPGKALSLTDKAFDLAKGMTMKVSSVPVASKRSIKTEFDENSIKRKKDDVPTIKEESLSMGQVIFLKLFKLNYLITKAFIILLD